MVKKTTVQEEKTMTKKLLCLVLCVSLILPGCIIPANGAAITVYDIEDGILYAEDFEGTVSPSNTNITVTKKSEEDISYLGFIRNSDANAANSIVSNSVDISYIAKGLPFMVNFPQTEK